MAKDREKECALSFQTLKGFWSIYLKAYGWLDFLQSLSTDASWSERDAGVSVSDRKARLLWGLPSSLSQRNT
jgi:hypothetical protein